MRKNLKYEGFILPKITKQAYVPIINDILKFKQKKYNWTKNI